MTLCQKRGTGWPVLSSERCLVRQPRSAHLSLPGRHARRQEQPARDGSRPGRRRVRAVGLRQATRKLTTLLDRIRDGAVDCGRVDTDELQRKLNMGPRACQALPRESMRPAPPAPQLRSSTSHGLVRPTARSAALIDSACNEGSCLAAWPQCTRFTPRPERLPLDVSSPAAAPLTSVRRRRRRPPRTSQTAFVTSMGRAWRGLGPGNTTGTRAIRQDLVRQGHFRLAAAECGITANY